MVGPESRVSQAAGLPAAGTGGGPVVVDADGCHRGNPGTGARGPKAEPARVRA